MTHNIQNNSKEYLIKLRNEVLKDESFELIRKLNIEKERVFSLQHHIHTIEDQNTHTINYLNNKINAIYSSSSWKFSYPIRFFKDILTNKKKSNQNVNQSLDKEITKDYNYWINKIEPLCFTKEKIVLNHLYHIIIFVKSNNYKNVEKTILSIKNNNVSHKLYIINLSNLTEDTIKSHLINLNINSYLLKSTTESNVSTYINEYLNDISNQDWLIYLKSGDELSENCLNELNLTIKSNPNANIIYSDEDEIDSNHIRSNPNFKPDFNLFYFYSSQYINNTFTIKVETVKKHSFFDNHNLETQFFSLLLNALTVSNHKNQLIHIPKILFHLNKIYNKINYLEAKKILQNYFINLNKNVDVSLLDNNYGLRIKTKLEEQPLVSILIPTRNGLHLLSRCITSIIEKTTYKNYEIIVIDNGSDENKTINYLKSITCDFIKVIRDDSPFNYSTINNNAVEQANGDYICLMNNDTEVITEDWLTEMMSFAIEPDIGCVGAKLLYPNDNVQHGGVILGIGGLAGHCHWNLHESEPGYFNRAQLAQELSAVTAACLIVKKSIYKEVGGLDPSLAVAFNDVNFCLDVLYAGYKNIWTPFAKLYHFESATRGYEDTPEKMKRFAQEVDFMKNKWGDLLLKDTSYNINLCLQTSVSAFTLGFIRR